MEMLIEIEAIKKLKAAYFRHLDNKEWSLLADCLSDDASFSYPVQNIDLKGKEAVIKNLSDRHAETRTAHTGSMPEIELIAENTAYGIWFMMDIVISIINSDRKVTKGYGRYYETYTKASGSWKIKSIRLERLFTE